MGTRLASASWDSTAKVWDLASGVEITTFSGHTSPVWLTDVTFSADGRSVFTGGDDDFVRQWDAGTGQEIRTFSGDGKDIYGIALSPDGQSAGDGRPGRRHYVVGCGFRREAEDDGGPCRAAASPGF